jgi:micrococcal nuclease
MAHRIFDFDKDRRRKRPAPSGRTPHRRRKADAGIPMGWVWSLIGAVAILLIVRSGHLDLDRLAALWSQPQAGTTQLVALAPATPRAALPARAMPICGGGRRIDCVVDGDTFWIDGEKVRVETIDAPEVKGRCASETALAARATRRLAQLLSNRSIELSRNGTDRYGRTLARVRTSGGDVGAVLVGEGLAQRWTGSKAEWCAA